MQERNRRLWLIDAGYLFHTGLRLDYAKLRTKLEHETPIWRAYYFNSVPASPSPGMVKFHNWLRSAPPLGPKIITKLYGLKGSQEHSAYCAECGSKVSLRCPNDPNHTLHSQTQKGVDVGIATTALTLAPEYETLLLSSGDGDLTDAVDHLIHMGKRFELVVFREGVSTELQARSDEIHWLNEWADEIRRSE